MKESHLKYLIIIPACAGLIQLLYCYDLLDPLLNHVNAYANLILVIVTIFYVIYTKKILNETVRQNIEERMPIIIMRIAPDDKYFNMYYISIHNSGKSAAYDVNAQFEPDLPYGNSTLNSTSMMNNISCVMPGEIIKYFFASVPEYLQNESSPKETSVEITYKKTPKEIPLDSEVIKSAYKINMLERVNMLTLNDKDFSDIVKELEEIKQGLLILLAEKKDENN